MDKGTVGVFSSVDRLGYICTQLYSFMYCYLTLTIQLNISNLFAKYCIVNDLIVLFDLLMEP